MARPNFLLVCILVISSRCTQKSDISQNEQLVHPPAPLLLPITKADQEMGTQLLASKYFLQSVSEHFPVTSYSWSHSRAQ